MTKQSFDDADFRLSLRDGKVWMNWRESQPPGMIGDHTAVLEEMRRFIEQSEAAERMLRKARELQKHQAERQKRSI